MRHKTEPSVRIVKLSTIVVIAASFVGCGPSAADYGETTKAFVGHVVQNGKPITLPEDSRLNVTQNSTYHRFGIPLKQDGSFTIGWMPVGAYSVELIWIRQSATGSTSQERYGVPHDLVIEKEPKEYEIELGQKWKR